MKNVLTYGKIKTDFIADNIWANRCERSVDQYVLFRTEIEISGMAETEITIYADTYYNLYIDGAFVNRGPVRSYEYHAAYDTIHFVLKEGKHTIAVMAHHLGEDLAAHRTGSAAFWLEMKDANGNLITATNSEWKACYCDAFTHYNGIGFTHYDFAEDVDMRKFPTDWNKTGFDDSGWDSAVVLSKVGSKEDAHTNYTSRQYALFRYIKETGEIVRRGTYAEHEEVVDFPYHVNRRAYDTDKRDGSYVLGAFDCSLSGTIEISYSNAKSGCELIIHYDDQLAEDGFPPRERWPFYSDRFLLQEGDGKIQVFMPRGFRYVLVTAEDNCCIESVCAVREEYPFTECRPFLSENKTDTEIFEQSLKTQRVCTIDGFADCVNRERVLWLGDAYIDFIIALYSEPDDGLMLSTLYEHAFGQKESGAVGGYNSSNVEPGWLQMSSYNMLWLHMLHDYILYTGKTQNVEKLKDTAKGILTFLKNTCNSDGISDTDTGVGNTFWDWGYNEPAGESLKVTAYYMFTLERLAKLEFFQDIIEPEVLASFDSLKKYCFERFWDKERMLFHDSGKQGGELHPLCSQGANMLAILSGICPDALADDLVNRVLDPNMLERVSTQLCPSDESMNLEEKVLPCATMYGSFFIVQALFEKGYHKEAVQYMRDVWGVYTGEPTLPEMRFASNAAENLTCCHGWSGAPGYILPRYVLGIHPITEGWEKVAFTPAKLEEAMLPGVKGFVQTPFGPVKAQISKVDDVVKLFVSAPEGVEIFCKYNGYETNFRGDKVIYLMDK